MDAASIERVIERIPGLSDTGGTITQAIHRAVLSGGDRVRTIADILHGTWLGHPLHPVLTDIPIAAWTLTAALDWCGAARDSPELAKMADTLNAIGVLTAVPTALAGITDYSAIQQQSIPVATAHGLLNTTGLLLSAVSWRDRAAGNRGRAVKLSSAAVGILMASAWLGGEMVYRQRAGVDHHEEPSGPDAWTATIEAADLPERTAKRVEVDGAPVLLYRDGTALYAIGAVCSHAGGPLDEGTIEHACVRCPWHDSVFDLRDGAVVHGPATYAEPAYDARTRDGKVEVRLRPATMRA